MIADLYDSLTCRVRKLKCDEAKPFCGNCTKASRDCVFTERAVFRNIEVQSFSGPDESCVEDHVWLEVPKDRKLHPMELISDSLADNTPQ